MGNKHCNSKLANNMQDRTYNTNKPDVNIFASILIKYNHTDVTKKASCQAKE